MKLLVPRSSGFAHRWGGPLNIFRRAKSSAAEKYIAPGKIQQTVESESLAPRYARPKIVALDLRDDVASELSGAGYNVRRGSLGCPYRVVKSDGYGPVVRNGDLVELVEPDIVIADLRPERLLPSQIGDKEVPGGHRDWWASLAHGVIDPRPREAMDAAREIGRMLFAGGALILFADADLDQDVRLALLHGRVMETIQEHLDSTIWNLCGFDEVFRFMAVRDRGSTIVAEKSGGPVADLLTRHLEGADFRCTVRAFGPGKELWRPIAKNKFGHVVGGVLGPMPNAGAVIVVPHLTSAGRFLLGLLDRVLPEMLPGLFPSAESLRWVERPEYWLKEEREFQRQIENIQHSSAAEIERLESLREERRENRRDLDTLVTGSGPHLVKAVERTLRGVGFANVVNVDETEGGEGKEDLQVLDGSPAVVVEVKGIGGTPSDEDALQVAKRIAPRMRDWNRTDIRGLAIINHQRHLPVVDRLAKGVFGSDVIAAAEHEQVGLMTGAGLYRLARGCSELGWRHEQVRDLFATPGLVDCTPTHYSMVGVVGKIWPKASSFELKVQGSPLSKGDRIAIETALEFIEGDVESLQVDGADQESVGPGAIAGIRTALVERTKGGERLFRVGA